METSQSAGPTAQDDSIIAELRQWLRENWTSPEDYIIGAFARHDVVLLAEDHGIQHNLLLVHRLIPRLHAAGIYTLGMEFGASEDQSAVDALTGVTGMGSDYDAALARQLMFNYNTRWAYQEYIDIYRTVWAFNRDRPPGSRPFRVLNLSYRYDWRHAGPVQTPASAERVFHKGGTEAYRAAILRREVLNRGEKALILTGTIHAFTRYAPPVFDHTAPGFVRHEHGYMGQLLYESAPEKLFVILLHQPFASKYNGAAELVYPAGGALDRAMAGFADQRAGFDLLSTPPGDLRDDSYYASGYADFTLGKLADGYIYEAPFDRFEGCTVDKQFMTAANWPEARANFPDPHWHRRPDTPAEYWGLVRNYVDIAQRYSRLPTLPG